MVASSVMSVRWILLSLLSSTSAKPVLGFCVGDASRTMALWMMFYQDIQKVERGLWSLSSLANIAPTLVRSQKLEESTVTRFIRLSLPDKVQNRHLQVVMVIELMVIPYMPHPKVVLHHFQVICLQYQSIALLAGMKI